MKIGGILFFCVLFLMAQAFPSSGIVECEAEVSNGVFQSIQTVGVLWKGKRVKFCSCSSLECLSHFKNYVPCGYTWTQLTDLCKKQVKKCKTSCTAK